MRIIVTGADGFIGGHLHDALKQKGHTVFAHQKTDCDIVLPGALDRYTEIDMIYHLAAQTFVPDSWKDTHSYFSVNVMGTITALEYCRKTGAALVLMSTYVYGTPHYLPVDEQHPVQGVTPYHESKLLCEELCRFYVQQFKLNICVIRPFNVYGKGQNDLFLMPLILKQILDENCKIVEVLDLAPKRDYIYIDDLVNLLLLCMTQKPTGFCVYNAGSGESVSVEDAIRTIMDVAEVDKPYRAKGVQRTNEILNCVADMTKANKELAFTSQFTFKEGIAAWLRELDVSAK